MQRTVSACSANTFFGRTKAGVWDERPCTHQGVGLAFAMIGCKRRGWGWFEGIVRGVTEPHEIGVVRYPCRIVPKTQHTDSTPLL